MTTKRCYGQGGCAVSHALDLVGERWALLIVRELLLGPKRFTDLRTGLASASPNVLAQRLRELEESGVVRRRRLGPPTPAWVYELTEWGHELESVVISLGRWGARSPLRPEYEAGSDSVLLALKALFDPSAAKGLRATYQVRFGDDRFAVTASDGILTLERGDQPNADAVIDTDPGTWVALLTGRQRIAEAKRDGRLRISGDAKVFERLLQAVRVPERAEVPSPA